MPQQVFKKLHAIQLETVKVAQLFIKSNQAPDHIIEAGSADFSFSYDHSPYNTEHKTIWVRATVEIGMEKNPKTPFSMRIQLIGFFRVDDQKFDVSQIDHWADKNAPMILYPFTREHAFALSARCGFGPVVLPLLEVPTLVPKRRRKPVPQKDATE